MRPEYSNQVCSYDFIEDCAHNGRKFRMLNVIDEFMRECISIRANWRLKAVDVIDVLTGLFILRGVPPDFDLIVAPSSLPRLCVNGSPPLR